MFLPKRRLRRKGFSAVQWMLIASVVVIVMILSVQLVGTESKESLEQTSGGVGDPSTLVDMVD